MLKKISLFLILACFYIAIKWLVPNELDQTTSLSSNEFSTDYQMEQVTSTHFDNNGEPSYRLEAKRINYQNEHQKSEFINPNVVIGTDDAEINIASPLAHSTNMNTIQFPDHVLITSKHKQSDNLTTISTSKVTASLETKTIATTEYIEITTNNASSSSKLSGKGLSMDLNNNVIEINQDLKSEVEIKSDNEK